MNKKVISGIWLICIFVVGVIFHYYYGYFSKSIEVLPDEIRYYSIARSMFLGDGLLFRGAATDYQKIGYTLYLIPFFLIKNGILRMKAITLGNAIIMMASIFPLYGIMKRLQMSKKAILIFLTCFIIFPDLMYSASFMAETLFWPIVLLFIYLWMVNREKKNFLISIAMGLVAYMGYLTKEIFLALILSIVFYEIVYPIVEHLVEKKTKKLKEYYNAKSLINTAIVVVVFVLAHIIIKAVFFYGLGNSYDQMGIEAIMSVDKILYLMYGAIYYIAAVLISCQVLPMLMPAFVYNKLNKEMRSLYFFNIVMLLASIATIAYTITVREDYPSVIPRLHFRYIGPYIALALLLFVATALSKEIKLRISKGVVITTVITLFVTFGVFRGIVVATGIDQFVLDWVYVLTTKLGNVWGIFLVDAIVVVFTVVVAALLTLGRKKTALLIAAAAMLILSVVNTITAKQRLWDYMYRDEGLVGNALSINDYMKDVSGGILYVADYSAYEPRCKCIDTFVDKNKNLYYTTYHFTDDMTEGATPVEKISIPMQFNLWDMSYDDIDSIEYIIVNNNNEEINLKIGNVDKIDELSSEYYTVYKNRDAKTLTLEGIR